MPWCWQGSAVILQCRPGVLFSHTASGDLRVEPRPAHPLPGGRWRGRQRPLGAALALAWLFLWRGIQGMGKGRWCSGGSRLEVPGGEAVCRKGGGRMRWGQFLPSNSCRRCERPALQGSNSCKSMKNAIPMVNPDLGRPSDPPDPYITLRLCGRPLAHLDSPPGWPEAPPSWSLDQTPS